MSGRENTRGLETNRLRLVVALVLTFVAIGTGTWVLGSGPDDSGVNDSQPVVNEMDAPDRVARPPLAVAPPPTSAK